MISLIFVLSSMASVAYADDPRKAEGEKIYQQGYELHNKGRDREAIEKFRQAFTVYPSPNILIAWARSEELTDQPLAAMRHYREALKNPVIHPRNAQRAKDNIALLQNAQRAKDNIALLQKRLGRIEVRAPEGTTFVLDGQKYTTPLSEPIDVLPGTVAVSAKFGDITYDGSAVATAGEVVIMELTATNQPAAATTEPPPATTPTVVPPWRYDDSKDKVYKRQTNTTRYIVSGTMIGLGVVGLGMGVGFTAAANSASNNQKNAGNTLGTSTSACSSGATNCGSLQKYVDNRVHYSNIAAGSYIAGGVLVVGGVAAYFMMPKTQKRYAAVVPWVGKDGAGLAYGKEF